MFKPAGPTEEDFAALSKVIECLGPLKAHDAKRVLYATAVFFGMVPMERLVLDDPNEEEQDARPTP